MRICSSSRPIVSIFSNDVSFNWAKAIVTSGEKFSVSSFTFVSFFVMSARCPLRVLRFFGHALFIYGSKDHVSRNLLAFADNARAGPLIQDTNSGLQTFKCVYYVLYIYITTYMTHLTFISSPLCEFIC